MFGRSDSPNTPKFIKWGLKGVGNAEIRQKYKSNIDAKVVSFGLDVPDEHHARRFI
jgi:1,2-phenylacetyl-CoA epoxidase catalytic subunit